MVSGGGTTTLTIQSHLVVTGVGSDPRFTVHSDGSVEVGENGMSATFSPSGAISGLLNVPGTNGVSVGPEGETYTDSAQTYDVGSVRVSSEYYGDAWSFK